MPVQDHRVVDPKDNPLFVKTEEFHVEVTEPPSFLKQLAFGEKQPKIWFLTKSKSVESEDPSLTPSKVSVKQPNFKRSTNTDLDLTGSPLKCSFNLEEENFDDSFVFKRVAKKGELSEFVPLQSSEARLIMSYFNLEAKEVKDVDEIFPCWAYCNGSDGTLFIGSDYTDETVFKLTKITCTGPFSAKDPEMQMEKFIRQHSAMVLINGVVKKAMEARAIYTLTSDDLGEDAEQGSGPQSCLEAQLSWKSPGNFLENPSVDALASLKMKVCPGDPKMPTFTIWDQLTCLLSFVDGLEDKGISWRQQRDGDQPIGDELTAVLEKVRTEGPREGNRKPREASSNLAEENKDEVETIVGASRENTDFTDMLWSVLFKVESYKQLTLCLQLIFEMIKNEKLRPYLYSFKATKMGEIVHSLVRGTSDVIPDLSDRLPLELLVEMGLEKLKRDYVHALTTSFLTTKEEIMPFLTNSSTFGDSVRKLTKLHLVLELVVLVQTFLSPNQEFLRKIALQAVQILKQREASAKAFSGEEFEFDVHISDVKDRLAKLIPNVWQCRIRTETKRTSHESVAHLSVEPPLPIVKQDAQDTPSNNVQYFYTVKSTVSRVRFGK